MCLYYNVRVQRSCGIGFKVVRKSKLQDTYHPCYPYFYLDGSGGTFDKSNSVFSTQITYTLNKLSYAENHIRLMLKPTHMVAAKSYLNDIHIYKEYKTAEKEFAFLMKKRKHPFVIIKCSYFGAHSQDDEVIVASAITVLEEINNC